MKPPSDDDRVRRLLALVRDLNTGKIDLRPWPQRLSTYRDKILFRVVALALFAFAGALPAGLLATVIWGEESTAVLWFAGIAAVWSMAHHLDGIVEIGRRHEEKKP
jgi:hypothetical protein